MSELTNKDESETDRTQEVISKLVEICQATNEKYPSGTDYRYFCSYQSFNEQSNNLSNNVLNLLNKLCNFVNPNQNNIDLLSESNEYLRWQTVSDSADNCIEKVDIALDHIKELNNHQSLHNGTASKRSHSSRTQHNKLFSGQIHDNNSLELLYPQKAFLDLIDNKRKTRFKPNLTNGKPHSQKPFALELIGDDDDDKHYAHPYCYEIEHIQYDPQQLCHRKEQDSHSIHHTLLYWIDNEAALAEMTEALHCTSAIAVDLEHHKKHSFLGLTCLIQISTRNRDYIIDPLALREHIHTYLMPVFTNPKIVKVFHGCSNDIQWLQRDFSIYVVNLFDTFEASKLLRLKQKSLKYLLQTYCGIDTNKALRCTDWRVRPLRPELIDYARKDTHYLLYLYDHLTNKLIEQSTKDVQLLTECYDNSAKQCLIRYEKPVFSAKGWQYLCQKKGWYFVNSKSLIALRKLYEWRDRIARELDQSTEVVLSDKLLKQIVSKLPQKNLASNVYHLSVVARKYKEDILNIVRESMEDEESIDPMFEVAHDAKDKDAKSDNDLEVICESNEGCLFMDDEDVVMNNADLKVNKCDMNMMQADAQKEETEANKCFFPMIDNAINAEEGSVFFMVDDIFNEIANEPVFNRKYEDNNNTKIAQKTAKRVKPNIGDRKAQNKAKQKRNNKDRVAHALDRGKIFGSRYLDVNSKKDVFKLPREKKRKRKEGDLDGNLVDDIKAPKAKKQKLLSRYQKMQEKLKEARKEKRIMKIGAVEECWPLDKTQSTAEKMKKVLKKKKNANKKKKTPESEEPQNMEITEEDLLDNAPIAVLDTKFDNVYDPFKN